MIYGRQITALWVASPPPFSTCPPSMEGQLMESWPPYTQTGFVGCLHLSEHYKPLDQSTKQSTAHHLISLFGTLMSINARCTSDRARSSLQMATPNQKQKMCTKLATKSPLGIQNLRMPSGVPFRLCLQLPFIVMANLIRADQTFWGAGAK